MKINLERIFITSAILGRFLLTTTSAFGIATAANWSNYKGYWEGTIFRVQTTDFNILSHTLPTKLSYALQKRDYVELQRTLNSNYGLFGMVVTNCTTTAIECPSQKVLYMTESTSSWRQQLKIQDLSQHPYDILRDPPPLITEGGFENSRDRTWNDRGKVDKGKVNRGKVVGRVYYIRGIPPEFWTDYSDWLEQLPASVLSDRGAHRYYALTVGWFLYGGLAAWAFVERILFEKRLQKRLAQQEEQKLLEEAEQLRNQTVNQLQRQEALLFELKRHRREQEALSNSLAQKIVEYENALEQKELERQNNNQNLENLNYQLQELQKRQAEGQEQLQQREQAIANLQAQIATQRQGERQTDESLKQLQHNLQATQQKLISTSSRVQSLDDSIISITQERDLVTQQVKQLEHELQTVRRTQAEKIIALTEALEVARAELERVQQDIRSRDKQNEDFLEDIIQENDLLKKEFDQLQDKNLMLEDKCLQCQRQVQQLEKQLELFKAKRLDLSNLTLALVGGHPNTRRHVLQTLQSEYSLQSVDAVEIPPERSFNTKQLKSKIGNCTLVVILTYYCSHPLRNMVISLEKCNALAGQVLELPASCRGKNAIVEGIIQFVMAHSELLQN